VTSYKPGRVVPAVVPAAIVTGSSRGIGAAVARRFAADGYDVAVNYHTSAEAAEHTAAAVREAGSEAVVVGADVSDPEGAERLVDATVEAFGGVAHLVNNAGIDQHLHTEDLPPEDFDRVMDVNVNSAFNCTKAALPHLREAARAGDDGDRGPGVGGDANANAGADADPDALPDAGPSVCNVSSLLAHTGAAVECHYAASKGALVSLTRSHATDFAPGVRVNCVAPGHVETDMTADRSPAEAAAEREGIPVDRFGRPAEIADAVAYLRDAGFVTGETLNVNGGETMR
jgi:3-oxoacyl-[acyl-carrier protein] reductase